MRVFVDVEWENETTRELVSLALVTQDGQHRFYAERTPLPKAPSNFVREVGPSALPDGAFFKELRVFLASLKDPLLIADSDLDFILLSHALRGFGQQDLPSAVPYRYMLATFGDVLTRIEEYLENRPHAKVRRHHAMVDTEALRWAFEATITSGSGPLEG
ncbi:3'-5' exoribonuclease [Vulcaniibacterium tengchongense]|uniref:Uncharacterized protein DUF5051 n=1 Tax=Vulcaniibacterium tengchongense TaxID=1273429 RepID=A0A3N4VRM5_9GAMM|nr:3'-5' exoribonuclease [Vulcaniibacterium tengchongense]RPE79717.1 uncharacterized protein DUF5051 [Vulcaniibacterium tengchongense]